MQTQWNQEHRSNVFSNVSKNQTLEWIQAFENKLITKNHGTQNKWIEYKTFELKYEKYKGAKSIEI